MQQSSAIGLQASRQIRGFSRWLLREYEIAAARRLQRRVRLWGVCTHQEVASENKVTEFNDQNRSTTCQ